MMLSLSNFHCFSRSSRVDPIDGGGNNYEGVHIASSAGTGSAALTAGLAGQRVHAGRRDPSPGLSPEWGCTRSRRTRRGSPLRIHIELKKVAFVVDDARRATLPVTGEGVVVLAARQGPALDLQKVPA